MGPKLEYLEAARRILAERPDLSRELEVELAYELQAVAERWLAKHPPE